MRFSNDIYDTSTNEQHLDCYQAEVFCFIFISLGVLCLFHEPFYIFFLLFLLEIIVSSHAFNSGGTTRDGGSSLFPAFLLYLSPFL